MHWTSLPSEPPPNDTRTLYGLLAQWQGVYFYGFPAQNPREDPQYHSARANYRCLDHGLSSSFFYLRNSLRQPTEHAHEDDDEGRGRFETTVRQRTKALDLSFHLHGACRLLE